MRIEVTQEDIDAGEADNCTECPVALAIRRACSGMALVHYDEVMLGQEWYPLPPEAREFILAFDLVHLLPDFADDRPPAPFAFEIEGLAS